MKRTTNSKRIPKNTSRKSKNTKMDVVITHVNGSSPGFQEAFENTKKLHYNPEINTIDSISSNRFNDNGELKYVLRSIAKNMSWVRNIYLVIDEYTEVPTWMKNVKVIRHKEIFQEYSNHLPTYNSSVIESFLHRIPGLSEPFIYMNNDWFVCKPIKTTDLYIDGKLAIFYDTKNSPIGIPTVKETEFNCYWKNSNKILDAKFGTHHRKLLHHAPFVISKKIINTLWKEYPIQLSKSITSRFRSIHSLNLTSLHPYYAFHKGKTFTPNDIKCEFLYCSELKDITKDMPHFLCINDNRYENTSCSTIPFLEKIFPEISKYESISNI